MADETNKKPLRVGLTGGIASGKSTVAKLFADLGVPIIDTDVIARDIVRPGEPALEEIRHRFGASVIGADGCLDRTTMRALIFSDDQARTDLEAILHPRIGAKVREQADATDGPYQLIVIPLLVGSPLRRFLDRVLVVDCDEDIQMQRLLLRDAESVEQARRILEAQPGRKDRLAIADDVIRNNTGLRHLHAQVIDLDAKYRQLSTLPDPHEPLPEKP